VYAGADLGLDGTEPAHHRALVCPDDIEARGQMGSQKKAKDGEDPIAMATHSEERSSGTRPRFDSARQIFCGVVCCSPRVANQGLI
jgi:hypothetical protein